MPQGAGPAAAFRYRIATAETVAVNQATREATLRSRLTQAEWLTAQIARAARGMAPGSPPVPAATVFGRRAKGGRPPAVPPQASPCRHGAQGRRDGGAAASRATDCSPSSSAATPRPRRSPIALSCAFAFGDRVGGGRRGTSPRIHSRDQRTAPAPGSRGGPRRASGDDPRRPGPPSPTLAPRLFGALVEHYGFDMGSARYFGRLAERAPRDAALGEAGLTSLLPRGPARTLRCIWPRGPTAPTWSC